MLWTDKANKYLKKYWNIDNLKDKQFEVINELLLGNDVIGLLPTGYGKSMCYLLPPLLTKKVIFIISPLISLMDDQKDKLIKMKIPCAALHGNNNNKYQEIESIKNGKIKIVYMSPEYLISDGLELAELLNDDNKLGFMAIDESHCISVWGQDFRPEYTKIKIIRNMFPSIPILAVTATATDTVCNDITLLLQLNDPIIIKASFDRPNLFLQVTEHPMEIKIGKKVKETQVPKAKIVINYINKYPNQKIIVYVNSRKDTQKLSDDLNKINNNSCQAYHAGLNKNLRENIQNKFISGEINIIISTIAFGMGIDQIVKCVIIFGCPSSIEEYYQQIGRGGRDGKLCETILYFDYSKLVVGKYMIREMKYKYPMLYNAKVENLNKVARYAYINTCRRKCILEYFNELCNFFTCNNCDNCNQELIDMTDKIWPIIMGSNNMAYIINQIKNKYLIDKNMSDIFDSLKKWKDYIIENKITKNNLTDSLKIKLPLKIIKKENKIITNDFDNEIDRLSKLI